MRIAPIQSPPANGRQIIVGDVHGCANELERLIDKIAPTRDDRFVFLGDLINRGPNSRAVLDRVRTLPAQCILGNHEAKLLAVHQQGLPESLKKESAKTFQEMTAEDWEWISSWPLVLENRARSWLCVHGGFGPSIPWRSQPEEVILNIQILNEQGLPAKRKDAAEGRPWAEAWTGPEFVFYGHTPRLRPLHHPKALGLDTGCVYGGGLSAYIYPDDTIITIPAKEAYSSYVGGLKSL